MPLGDVATATYTGKVDANGDATITIRTLAVRSWRVSQVTIEMPTAPSGATCSLRKNGYLVTLMIAAGDSAAGDPPVIVRQEDSLTVEWENCTAGDIGKALIFYEVL